MHKVIVYLFSPPSIMTRPAFLFALLALLTLPATAGDAPVNYIAEMTGTTLHTVSRILSAWETQGLVEGGRQKLVVCDAPALKRLAENAG